MKEEPRHAASDFSLRARWVLPVDGAPIRDGFVSVVGGRIAAVGRRRPDAGPVDDLGDAILMPGLVNAHTHLEFSDLTAPLGAPGMSLPDWIRLVIAQRKHAGRDAAQAIGTGLAKSLAAGVTAIGEISTSRASEYPIVPLTPTTVLFQEAIGFSAARVQSVLADLERRLVAAGDRGGLSPHAPYTVHPLLLERIVQLAARRAAPVAMHLAESREELEFLKDGRGGFRKLLEERSMWDAGAIPAGSRPFDYLRQLVAAPRALVIHGNFLAADEIEFVAQRRERMSVVYCPRTHAYFQHEPYPLARMLAAGARVALGTDSRASNPDLSLLADLRLAAKTFPAVDTAELVRAATLAGAEALGLDKSIGSLRTGKRADMLALPCSGAGEDPYETVLSRSARPLGVWLGGRRIAVENAP